MPHLALVLWMSVSATPNFAVGPPPTIGREQAGLVQPDTGHTWLLGGQTDDGGISTLLSSTEILDADAGLWTAGPSLSSPREGLTALRLGGGDVLACGGKVGATLSKSCDRYFASDGGFWPTNPVSGTALPAHPGLAALSDGTALVAAGALYIYDPVADAFSQPGDLPNYGGKIATAGLDGTVWVGDTTVSGDLLNVNSGGTINDLGPLPFTPVEMGTLGTGAIVLLAANGGASVVTPPGDGQMTIAAVPGSNGAGTVTPGWSGGLLLIGTTSVYFLATDYTWSLVGDLALPRSNGAASSLPDGRVLYIGGRTLTPPIQSVADVDIIGESSGAGCLLPGQCLSGFCIGGVCCGTACTGDCQTCATGTCQSVAEGDPGQCGGVGACAGACEADGGCFFPLACVDAGPPNAGPPDAGPVDAGPADAGIPCEDDGGCPFTSVACGASCQSGTCVYSTDQCGLCGSCNLGVCDPIPAGTDPFNACSGTGGCGGACAGDGGCSFPTTSCSNGDVCISHENCAAGACTGGQSVANCCNTAADCGGPADGGGGGICGPSCFNNQCSFPTGTCGDCHQCETGACVEDNSLTCTDNNVCTSGDHCSSGTCVSNPPDAGCCNYPSDCPQATDVCQQATCDNNACGLGAVPGCCHSDGDCNDGNASTLDFCINNVCQFYFNVPDAGPVDAGPEDAGPADGGRGGHDGGHPVHDGGFDGGVRDAGPTDAGFEPVDGGDGGRADAGPVHEPSSGGCGCSSGLDFAGWAWFAPSLIGLAARRRRS